MMETASVLRRPPIEAISPLLKHDHPVVLTSIKLRQMIGNMVRQILKARGYHLDRANVRIKQSRCVFSFGSVYAKAG